MSPARPDYAELPSSRLERDMRDSFVRRPIDPGKIAIGVIIGRSAEFFDFFVYAIASVIVFPKILFPALDPITGTLYSFAIFSLAFIARPLGSVFFMRIDRLHGRSVKLTTAMFVLGASTASIAFLPSYQDVGSFSIYFLCVSRFIQGLALGGAWDGLPSLLALNAPANRRNFYAMIPQLGAPIGFVLAAALFAYFLTSISTSDFLEWGWRYPFFVAFTINVVALFARLRLVVTEEFRSLIERNELQAVRITELLRTNGPTVFMGAFVPLATYALFHLVTVFPLSWVVLYTKHSVSHFLLIEMGGSIIGAATIVLSGTLADRFGRRVLLGVCAVAIGIGSFITPFFYDKGVIGEDTIVLAGFAVLGLSFGQVSGALASNFQQEYRYTGAAITSDLAWLIGAGFAPFVALGINDYFGQFGEIYGLLAVGAYLLSGSICTLIALYFNHQLEHMRD
jgi:MFS family permease